MQNYKWLLMVLAPNGRYEKTLELPFVPQIGMTIFRGDEAIWGSGLADHYAMSPAIEKFGWNLDEDRFEIEFLIDDDIELNMAFWDKFIPL